MQNTLLATAFLAAFASQILPASQAAEPKRLLVVSVTTDYRHASIPTLKKILGQLARGSGEFTVDFLDQPAGKPADPPDKATPEKKAAFTTANDQWTKDRLKPALEKLSPSALKNYDGVIFASTSGELPIPDRAGFLAWLKAGHAFIGIHAASATFKQWPEYGEMLGGIFDKHGPEVGVECLNLDPKNPATTALPKTWTISQEEVYQFKAYDPARVHELLVMDKHPNDKTPGHYPVSWCREYGAGRVFYTSLGHREDILDADPNLPDRKNSVEISEAFQAHLLGGIEWALGLKTPTEN